MIVDENDLSFWFTANRRIASVVRPPVFNKWRATIEANKLRAAKAAQVEKLRVARIAAEKVALQKKQASQLLLAETERIKKAIESKRFARASMDAISALLQDDKLEEAKKLSVKISLTAKSEGFYVESTQKDIATVATALNGWGIGNITKAFNPIVRIIHNPLQIVNNPLKVINSVYMTQRELTNESFKGLRTMKSRLTPPALKALEDKATAAANHQARNFTKFYEHVYLSVRNRAGVYVKSKLFKTAFDVAMSYASGGLYGLVIMVVAEYVKRRAKEIAINRIKGEMARTARELKQADTEIAKLNAEANRLKVEKKKRDKALLPVIAGAALVIAPLIF